MITQKQKLSDAIARLEIEIKEKMKERGRVANEGGGWHDNSALDAINEELSVLESRLGELKEGTRELDGK